MTLKSVHFHLLLLHQVELYKHVANLKVDMILITEIVTLKFGSKQLLSFTWLEEKIYDVP